MIGSLVLVLGAVVALAPTDLLALRAARTGAALPASWVVRPVRGQRAPMSLIMDSAGEGFVRLSGTGTAGWFVHRPATPLAASATTAVQPLAFSWRVRTAPVGADLRSAKTDDATLRLFVVFESRERFKRTPRTLFYSIGSIEPRTYERASFQSRPS